MEFVSFVPQFRKQNNLMQYLRFLRAVMMVISAWVIVSCAETPVEYQLILSENGAAFAAEGGEREISVLPFPDGVEWVAECSEEHSWFTIEVYDDAFKVTAGANQSHDARSAGIILSNPEGLFEDVVFPVSQEGADERIFAVSAPESYSFDSEGGEYVFTVRSSSDWTVETESAWLKAEADAERSVVVLSAGQNAGAESLTAVVTVKAGENVFSMAVSQGTRAENPYLRLLGKWEITAAKWYYSPNGSLNSLDYNPNQSDYYLIFDLVEDKYGETFIMKDFLYPGTSLQVKFDKETGGIRIPFGWPVYAYEVFLYVTFVSSKQFAYASLEAEAKPSQDYTALTLDLPLIDGFNYVGFGLWTYDDNGNKVAFGYSSRPTMFPMSPIVFRKYTL